MRERRDGKKGRIRIIIEIWLKLEVGILAEKYKGIKTVILKDTGG